MADKIITPRRRRGAKQAAVYKIENTVTGRLYVGASVDVHGRWAVHKYQLRKRTHANHRLQSDWDELPPDSFVFEILECVDDPDAIHEKEQWHMDLLRPSYNLAPTAGSNAGIEFGEEARRRMSEASRGKNNYWYGKTLPCAVATISPERRMALSKARAGTGNPMFGVRGPMAKLSDDDVREIRAALAAGEKSKALADKYGVSTGAIQHIKKGRSYRDVV